MTRCLWFMLSVKDRNNVNHITRRINLYSHYSECIIIVAQVHSSQAHSVFRWRLVKPVTSLDIKQSLLVFSHPGQLESSRSNTPVSVIADNLFRQRIIIFCIHKHVFFILHTALTVEPSHLLYWAVPAFFSVAYQMFSAASEAEQSDHITALPFSQHHKRGHRPFIRSTTPTHDHLLNRRGIPLYCCNVSSYHHHHQ